MVRMQTRHLRFIRKNLIRSVLILLLISLVYVLQQGSVKASPLVDWLSGDPTTVSSYPVKVGNHISNQPNCAYQKITVRSKYNGIVGTSQMDGCVVKGKYLSLAHTTGGMYVSFGSDSYFYMFHTDNTGVMIYSTVLVPNADQIGFVMSSLGHKSVRVYDDFSSRLTLDEDTLRYRMTNWDNPLFPVDGQPVVGGVVINFSNNGRYAVYQNADDWPGSTPGLVRVDLETGEKKQFGIMWYGNFASSLPNPHYVISNDGATVIGGGIGILSAWSLSDACVKDPYVSSNRMQNDCPARVFADTSYGEAFDPQSLSRTYGLELNDDASELSFLYRPPNSNDVKRINLSPAGYVSQTPRLEYLALGDSYSSGEGDTERDKRTNEKYYRAFTDMEEDVSAGQPREKCHISTRSYPYVLAQGMGLGSPQNNSNTRWQTVACSGATTFDIDNENKDEYKGQGKGGEEEGKPRLEGYDMNAKKAIALNEFIPGRNEQIEFVDTYKPKVITLTIGGNDVGFSQKIKDCVMPGTCKIATEQGRSGLMEQIRSQYANLKSLYEEIYKASDKKAKIYIFGYPQFVSDNIFTSCQATNIGLLDSYEREMTYNSLELMNNVIEQAAKAAGVKYVDIEDSLKGGRLCDSGQMYMTGLTGLFGWNANQQQESFHPNAKGNNQIAMAVWEQVNHESLSDYDICPNTTENACPDNTATEESIVLPPYFQVPETGYEIEYVSDMTYGTITKGDILKATRSSYSFSPNSTVEVTLFSEPTNLGSFTTSDNGSLEASLHIPVIVPAGYHTLVAEGTTYSGESIRYEQIILVKGSNLDDIDENGEKDSEQRCGPFLTAGGVDSDLDGIDDVCDPQITDKPELYRWRWGYSGRNYGQYPEDENQIYIERNIWASSVTGVSGDYDPDNDGWAVVGVSQMGQLNGVSMDSADTAIDFEILGNGTSGDPRYPAIYIQPGSEQCIAYKPISLTRVLAEESRTLTIANISNEKCPQRLPVPENSSEPKPGTSKVDELIFKIRKSFQILRDKINSLVSICTQLIPILFMSLRR